MLLHYLQKKKSHKNSDHVFHLQKNIPFYAVKKKKKKGIHFGTASTITGILHWSKPPFMCVQDLGEREKKTVPIGEQLCPVVAGAGVEVSIPVHLAGAYPQWLTLNCNPRGVGWCLDTSGIKPRCLLLHSPHFSPSRKSKSLSTDWQKWKEKKVRLK